MNSVYMDNNATTSLKKEVLNAMMPLERALRKVLMQKT